MKLDFKQIAILFLNITAIALAAYPRRNYKPPSRLPLRQSGINHWSSASVPKTVPGECSKRNSVIPDSKDPMSYKLCVLQRGNWVMFKYHCPSKSYFDEYSSRCVTGVPKMPPTNSNNDTVTMVQESNKTTSTSSSISTNSSMEVIEIQTEATMNYSEATDSSSSSEEAITIFLTHPPEFTQKPPYLAQMHNIYIRPASYSTISPSSSLDNLNWMKYTPFTPFPKVTRAPKPNQFNHQQKLTTWQTWNERSSPETFSTTTTQHPLHVSDVNETYTYDTNLTNSSEFPNPINTITFETSSKTDSHEKLAEDSTNPNHLNTTPTSSPSRWKPHTSTDFPARERFPSLRPSLRL